MHALILSRRLRQPATSTHRVIPLPAARSKGTDHRLVNSAGLYANCSSQPRQDMQAITNITKHPPQRKVVQEERLGVYGCHGERAAAAAAASGGGPAGLGRQPVTRGLLRRHRSCWLAQVSTVISSLPPHTALLRTQGSHLVNGRGRQRQQPIAPVRIMSDQLQHIAGAEMPYSGTAGGAELAVHARASRALQLNVITLLSSHVGQ